MHRFRWRYGAGARSLADRPRGDGRTVGFTLRPPRRTPLLGLHAALPAVVLAAIGGADARTDAEHVGHARREPRPGADGEDYATVDVLSGGCRSSGDDRALAQRSSPQQWRWHASAAPQSSGFQRADTTRWRKRSTTPSEATESRLATSTTGGTSTDTDHARKGGSEWYW